MTLGAPTTLHPSHEPSAQLAWRPGCQPKGLLGARVLNGDQQQPLRAFALRSRPNWASRSIRLKHALQHFVWPQATHEDRSLPSQAEWNGLNSFDWLVQVPGQTRSPRRTSLTPSRGQFQAWSYDRPFRLRVRDNLTLLRAWKNYTPSTPTHMDSRNGFANMPCTKALC